MKRLMILAMIAAATGLRAAESGLVGDAPRLAAGTGIGLASMEGVPRSFGVGAFEAKITLRNLIELPLRGRFAVKVAESDEEAPSFRVLAAATIDLTLPSVNPEPVALVAKGEIPADCLWRDLLVAIDARDREIVLFRGFVAGEGERPPRVRRVAVRRVVPGEVATRSEALVPGEDFLPKGFRAAFVTPDGARSVHVKSAQRANWKVESVHRGDAKGWAKLAGELDKLDSVVSLAGFPSGVESNAFVRFVERGGTLWVNGANEDAEIAGLAAFAPAGHEPRRYGAREILMSRFTEDDILAGRLVSEGSRLRQLVSQATG